MKLAARVFALLRNLIRELSDEAAYARHLDVTGRPHNPAEWRAFTENRYRRKFGNSKCC